MTSEELKAFRLSTGFSQVKMAKLLGMKQAHYSRLETGYEGRSPTNQHEAHIKALALLERLDATDLLLLTL